MPLATSRAENIPVSVAIGRNCAPASAEAPPPSGTMCNQIAFLVHCWLGDEIICAENAHVYGS
ncbi:low specificity L-threonine aldolase, partial [Agrobacterium tumefaciens]|uniref:beta-eliminating lyase-related protein n=1 Tax=Agrobacterium tumefaciens TaxID=358 RepID=UPI0015741A84